LSKNPQTVASGSWALDSTTISIGSQNISCVTSVFDTGTSFGVIPQAALIAIANAVPNSKALNDGSGMFAAPCSGSGPNIVLSFNTGQTLAITSNEYILSIQEGGKVGSTSSGIDYCAIGFQGGASQTLGFGSLMGNTFLK
jgi:hypothetical protein